MQLTPEQKIVLCERIIAVLAIMAPSTQQRFASVVKDELSESYSPTELIGTAKLILRESAIACGMNKSDDHAKSVRLSFELTTERLDLLSERYKEILADAKSQQKAQIKSDAHIAAQKVTEELGAINSRLKAIEERQEKILQLLTNMQVSKKSENNSAGSPMGSPRLMFKK